MRVAIHSFVSLLSGLRVHALGIVAILHATLATPPRQLRSGCSCRCAQPYLLARRSITIESIVMQAVCLNGANNCYRQMHPAWTDLR